MKPVAFTFFGFHFDKSLIHSENHNNKNVRNLFSRRNKYSWFETVFLFCRICKKQCKVDFLEKIFV